MQENGYIVIKMFPHQARQLRREWETKGRARRCEHTEVEKEVTVSGYATGVTACRKCGAVMRVSQEKGERNNVWRMP